MDSRTDLHGSSSLHFKTTGHPAISRATRRPRPHLFKVPRVGQEFSDVSWRRGTNGATGWRHTGVGTTINAICRAGWRLSGSVNGWRACTTPNSRNTTVLPRRALTYRLGPKLKSVVAGRKDIVRPSCNFLIFFLSHQYKRHQRILKNIPNYQTLTLKPLQITFIQYLKISFIQCLTCTFTKKLTKTK